MGQRYPCQQVQSDRDRFVVAGVGQYLILRLCMVLTILIKTEITANIVMIWKTEI